MVQWLFFTSQQLLFFLWLAIYSKWVRPGPEDGLSWRFGAEPWPRCRDEGSGAHQFESKQVHHDARMHKHPAVREKMCPFHDERSGGQGGSMPPHSTDNFPPSIIPIFWPNFGEMIDRLPAYSTIPALGEASCLLGCEKGIVQQYSRQGPSSIPHAEIPTS